MDISEIYLAGINLLLFVMMGIDKANAVRGRRRIPEATLFLTAVLGGALGGTLGMYSFRHKTLHKKFAIGFPLIAAADILAFIYFGFLL